MTCNLPICKVIKVIECIIEAVFSQWELYSICASLENCYIDTYLVFFFNKRFQELHFKFLHFKNCCLESSLKYNYFELVRTFFICVEFHITSLALLIYKSVDR